MIERINRPLKLWMAVLLVALNTGLSVAVVRALEDRSAALVADAKYENAINVCEDGNIQVNDPLSLFFSAYIADERQEPDDPELLAIAEQVRPYFEQKACVREAEAERDASGH